MRRTWSIVPYSSCKPCSASTGQLQLRHVRLDVPVPEPPGRARPAVQPLEGRHRIAVVLGHPAAAGRWPESALEMSAIDAIVTGSTNRCGASATTALDPRGARRRRSARSTRRRCDPPASGRRIAERSSSAGSATARFVVHEAGREGRVEEVGLRRSRSASRPGRAGRSARASRSGKSRHSALQPSPSCRKTSAGASGRSSPMVLTSSRRPPAVTKPVLVVAGGGPPPGDAAATPGAGRRRTGLHAGRRVAGFRRGLHRIRVHRSAAFTVRKLRARAA